MMMMLGVHADPLKNCWAVAVYMRAVCEETADHVTNIHINNKKDLTAKSHIPLNEWY